MFDIYTRCNDADRRLCSQAFFTKVFIDEDNELRVDNALTWAADANKARTSDNVSVGKGFEPCACGGGNGALREQATTG